MSFCLFILFIVMGFLQQEYCSGLPFPPPVDHVLSELFSMACLSWVALHSMAHSFIELHSHLRHNKAVIHEGCDLEDEPHGSESVQYATGEEQRAITNSSRKNEATGPK